MEIIENKCEGLVRLRDIGNDFYELDEKNYCIIGHRSGRVFRLGDEVEVVVKNADLVKKQIDFLLYGEAPAAPRQSDRRPERSGTKKNQSKSKGKRR